MNTFEELWQEVRAEAVALWATTKAEIVAEWKKAEPILEADVVIILRQLKTLAVQTVIELGAAEFAALTGKEKQGRVVATVFQHAEANGLALSITDAQMLGQQAYNYVEATRPQ